MFSEVSSLDKYEGKSVVVLYAIISDYANDKRSLHERSPLEVEDQSLFRI